MSLAEQLGQAILRLFPFLANDSEQVKDLKAQLAASASQIALMQAAAEADHGQIADLQATIKTVAAIAAAQAAEIAALKAGGPPVEEPPVEEPPTSEPDSPDGYSVAPGGQTITLAGVRWRLGTDKKIYRNDVVQVWSANAVELFLRDGKLWQKVVADWAPNGYFFLAKEGDAGQPGDPRVVVDPGTLPPVVKGVQLPAGFRDFTGMTMFPGRYDQDLNPSSWTSGDTIIPYRADLPFIKDGVLGLPSTALSDPNPGSAEVQFGEQYRYEAGEFWTVSLVDFHTAFNNAPCWTYGFYNGGGTPNGRISELDHEMSPLFGDAQGMHELRQGEVPPPMGPYYSWYKRVNDGIDWTKPVVSGLRWKINEFAEFYLYNLGQPQRMTNRVTPAQVPVGFINEPQKPCLSFRPTGWYQNEADRAAKRNVLAGWTGQWDGSAGLMQVLGFKANAI